jgi:uroporphyrinogen decarboxylase
VVDYLLDQFQAMLLHNVLLLVRAGVDIVLLADDVAMPGQMMVSPETWRFFFKARLAEVIRLAREEAPEVLFFYHCDGNFAAIVPDLVDIGVNVINPVQPDCMDAVAVKQAFGDRLALWGTAGTAWLLDRGRPGEIRDHVRDRIRTLGPRGLLLAPAYDIDFMPLANIEAFVDAGRRYGG